MPRKSCIARRKRRGATILEGALVLGVFLMFLMGALELTLAVLEVNTLSVVARHVARQAMVRGADCNSPLTTWGPATVTVKADQSHPIADIARPILVTMTPANVEVTVSWPDGSTEYDNRVKVVAKAKHQSILPMLATWFVSDLQSTSIMRITH